MRGNCELMTRISLACAIFLFCSSRVEQESSFFLYITRGRNLRVHFVRIIILTRVNSIDELSGGKFL